MLLNIWENVGYLFKTNSSIFTENKQNLMVLGYYQQFAIDISQKCQFYSMKLPDYKNVYLCCSLLVRLRKTISLKCL